MSSSKNIGDFKELSNKLQLWPHVASQTNDNKFWLLIGFVKNRIHFILKASSTSTHDYNGTVGWGWELEGLLWNASLFVLTSLVSSNWIFVKSCMDGYTFYKTSKRISTLPVVGRVKSPPCRMHKCSQNLTLLSHPRFTLLVLGRMNHDEDQFVVWCLLLFCMPFQPGN